VRWAVLELCGLIALMEDINENAKAVVRVKKEIENGSIQTEEQHREIQYHLISSFI